MVAAITADQMLARVKLRAQVPSTEGRLTDAEILTLIDDIIVTNVGRAVYDADDGRWVKTAADVTIAANRGQYRIPSRALASGVDEVLVINSAGDAEQLEYVDRSDAWEWGTSTGVPSAYTVIGDVVHLLPTPGSSGYALRVRYVRRPSRLVVTNACVVVTSATSSTISGSLISAIASGWESPEVVDIVEASNNVEALEDDVAVTFGGGTITRTSSGSFATSGAYAITAGDYVCLAGTACVVQVPDVAIAYIADLAARDVCVALDDQAGADRSAALAEQRRRDMEQAIAERSRTRPKIVPRNSPLRVGGQRSMRWRR